MKLVRIGCAGWAYREWRGKFYPEKLPQREWLQHYARTFDTVEVNNTFYRLPSKEAVKGWIDQTPEGFQFSVKGSRYLTHVKRLLHPEKYAVRFHEAIEPLAAAGKLGPVLWQLPPSMKADHERLAGALAALGQYPGRRCFEFRHPSWFSDTTYNLLREHGVALVVADDPKLPFQARKITADWTYIRFHRGTRGTYTKADLETWRRRIAAWRSRTEVLGYFNNDAGFGAPRLAAELGSSF